MSVKEVVAGVPLEHSALEHSAEERADHLLLDPLPHGEMNDMIVEATRRTGREFWFVIAVLALITLVGFVGVWVWQIFAGLGLAGVNRPVYWGLYITNFVFWIGISHSGTFVSAILRVFKAEYRRPITRAAELMTTVSLLTGAAFLGVDIGRVWRSYWILPYPNQRYLWPNYHSPFLWDEMAIITYLIGSTLYLLLPLVPDAAMARDRTTGWRHKVYRFLSFGWQGTERQWRNLRIAIQVFAFVIIPVMFSVHTIVSWDFAMTGNPGWQSTIFGPYFVVGAIFSGVSAVACILFLIRSTMKLNYFVRPEHFDAIGKLMLVFSFTWAYFYFNDFIVEWYSGEAVIRQVLQLQVNGALQPLWLAMFFFNIVIPWLTLWNRRIRRSPLAMFFIGFGINIGMWLERFIIVTGFTRRNRLPFNWGYFTPTIQEAVIAASSLAFFLLLYGLLTRLIPIIPVWEVREGQMAHGVRKVGKAAVTSVSELD